MKDRSYINISAGLSGTIRYHLRGLNILALSFCLIVLGLSIVLPMVILLKVAGPFSNYIRVFTTSTEQIIYSLSLAFSGALFSLLLGFFLSYLIERKNIKMRPPLELATILPLAIPAATLGIGLIRIWNQPFTDYVCGSSIIIILGYIARFIPFSVITVAAGLKQINPNMEEAAFMVTPRWYRVIGRIVIPLSRHSLNAGFFIVFILSFGEIGTTLLVIPPGRETIPIKIYNLMHYGAESQLKESSGSWGSPTKKRGRVSSLLKLSSVSHTSIILKVAFNFFNSSSIF